MPFFRKNQPLTELDYLITTILDLIAGTPSADNRAITGLYGQRTQAGPREFIIEVLAAIIRRLYNISTATEIKLQGYPARVDI